MGTKHEVHVHLVWGTSRRKPTLSAEIEAEIYKAIETKCIDLRCPSRAMGGTSHIRNQKRHHEPELSSPN
jgi:hypothetical protein